MVMNADNHCYGIMAVLKTTLPPAHIKMKALRGFSAELASAGSLGCGGDRAHQHDQICNHQRGAHLAAAQHAVQSH